MDKTKRKLVIVGDGACGKARPLNNPFSVNPYTIVSLVLPVDCLSEWDFRGCLY